MKTFKQFTAEWQRKKAAGDEKPYLHKDADGFYSAMAVMGSHSNPKKPKKTKLKEDEQKPGRIKDFNPWSHSFNQKKEDRSQFFNDHVLPIHEDLSDHFTHYSDDHLTNGIHPYTEDSSQLNKQLINRHIRNSSMDDDHHFTAHKLDEAMKINKTPYAMTLYSGSSHSPERYPIDETTGKRHMVFPAFTSTSISPVTANGFKSTDYHGGIKDEKYDGQHVYKFHVPEGHPAMYLENHTRVKNEHEMLLHRGMKVHVAAEPRTMEEPDPTYRGKTIKTHVWDAHVLPHDGQQKELG